MRRETESLLREKRHATIIIGKAQTAPDLSRQKSLNECMNVDANKGVIEVHEI